MKTETLFMNLVRVTTPHGHESYGYSFIPFITNIDGRGNVWTCIKRADGSLPNSMFSCHLDTAGHDLCLTGARRKGNRIISGGSSILGGDDKVGATVMIKMIEANIPGFYVFHVGEERGGVGSLYLSHLFEEQKKYTGPPDKKPQLLRWVEAINKCVAWDRRDTKSIITHQGGTRTCSDAFGNALAEAYGMKHKLDTGGSFTDSKNYRKLFSECTNVSAGFFNEHMHNESVDIEYVKMLVEQSLKINWEELPTSRDCTKEETKWRSGYTGYTGNKSILKKDTLVWLPYTNDVMKLTKARIAEVVGISPENQTTDLEHEDTRYELRCASQKCEHIYVRRGVLWVVPENSGSSEEAEILLGRKTRGSFPFPKAQPPSQAGETPKAVNLLKKNPSSTTDQETATNSSLLRDQCPGCHAELDTRDAWMGQCLHCQTLLPQWYIELKEAQ